MVVPVPAPEAEFDPPFGEGDTTRALEVVNRVVEVLAAVDNQSQVAFVPGRILSLQLHLFS